MAEGRYYDGAWRVARIIGEGEYEAAKELYDTAEYVSKTVGNYGRLGQYIGNKRSRQDSGHDITPAKKQKLIKMNLPKNKLNMPKGGNVNNKLVTRSAMKVSGQKRKLKTEKTVKVSKKFRAMVKKVEEGAQATGSYTKIYAGWIGSYVNTSTSGSNFRLSQGTWPLAVYGPNVGMPAGSRTLWSHLMFFKPQQPYATNDGDEQLTVGGALEFFTPQKIRDAASVCFNRRAIDPDAYVNDLNMLTTQFNLGNGDPATGVAGQNGLKIHISNSYVQFKMKNTSARVVEVDVYECTPRLKFVNQNALSSLYETFEGTGATVLDTATGNPFDNVVRYFNRQAANGSTGQVPGFILDGNFDAISMARQFGFQFNYTKKTMILAPGETCVHSIQGPKGIMDFSKLAVDQNCQNKHVKGFSVSCIFSVRGDQVFKPNSESNAQRLVPTYGPNPTATNNFCFGLPIAIEVEESYSIKVPEIAGFIVDSGVAGTRQMLNLRKKKIVVGNFIDANGDQRATTADVGNTATGSYLVNNEVNPVASISGNQWA